MRWRLFFFCASSMNMAIAIIVRFIKLHGEISTYQKFILIFELLMVKLVGNKKFQLSVFAVINTDKSKMNKRHGQLTNKRIIIKR